jgi:peptidoglycan/LPS O-acetylase OafA/YrhL
MPPRDRPATIRFDQIDVLRGLGIVAVILLHARQRFAQTLVEAGTAVPRWPYLIPASYNHNGLTIFFAISGFLITFISIRRFGSLERLDPPAFYRMRFARIAPFLFLLLIVLGALDLGHVPHFIINPHQTSLARVVFAVLTFHINWLESVRGTLPLAWEILWSLSVEEVFYLVFPLICVVLCRWMDRNSAFIALLVIFVTIGPFARALTNPDNSWHWKGYLQCSDAIAMGCLTGLAVEFVRVRGGVGKLRLLPIQLAGALMALFFALRPKSFSLGIIERWGLDTSLLAFSICLIIFASTLRNEAGSIWTAPLRFLGRYIYEAYLIHAFVVLWTVDMYLRVRRGPITLWYAAIFLLTTGIAWVCATYFSEPLNRRLRTPSTKRTSLPDESLQPLLTLSEPETSP